MGYKKGLVILTHVRPLAFSKDKINEVLLSPWRLGLGFGQHAILQAWESIIRMDNYNHLYCNDSLTLNSIFFLGFWIIMD